MMQTGRTEGYGGARRKLVIVAGPTASGKSALALALASRLAGTVMNADAMQCYRELRILTARPSFADEVAVPHALYGVRAAVEPANAAWWRTAALAEMATAGMPILCGGTGMYLAALLQGIAAVPAFDMVVRAEARALVAEIGAPALHARLMAVDPETAGKLFETDSQRIARAWEVWRGTGHGLAYWQTRPTEKLTGWDTRMILLDPPRPDLKTAIETRFAAMLELGAIEEVKDLLSLGLNPALPLLRAHGVPELGAFLRGETTLAAAAAAAKLVTFQYTKRQSTWFRHQALVDKSALHIIHARIEGSAQFSESFMDELVNFIIDHG
ncbi:MAG: tRNA (adenosine(37)-N6)-dimethylallyltransferase MiaA [Acidocella sp.]|nr:tRNA (adenosine(37)-N6)-dimethylallyltransferase MiaA [Acidocella sp.]